MRYLVSTYTDKGTVKKVNQDSLLVLEAKSPHVLFAAVSDGMGGLSHGEEASGILIRDLKFWFMNTLPLLLQDFSEDAFKESMQLAILDACSDIEKYSDECDADCGTTLSGLLLFGERWYAVNVGDSRVYKWDRGLCQITKDQTFVQREIDAGRMTEKEASTHKMRSMLLQCIGASDVVIPDWYTGTGGELFMLCSDGFRHVLSAQEMSKRLNPRLNNETDMSNALKRIAEKSMSGGERDNISAILIKVVM